MCLGVRDIVAAAVSLIVSGMYGRGEPYNEGLTPFRILVPV
jgi:hypothetical protein